MGNGQPALPTRGVSGVRPRATCSDPTQRRGDRRRTGLPFADVSFAYSGLPPAPPPPEPILATAIVVHRDGPDGREVLLVRRGAERRFAGGFHAFPGGRLDPEDAEIAVAGAAGEDAALLACATRELFEETGVLVASGAAHVGAEARLAGRRALLEGTITWGAFLRESGLSLSAALLAPAGRWVTP